MTITYKIDLLFVGGTSEYFVDNIVHFHLTESVFDLALLAALKIVLLVPFYSLLEDSCYKLIDSSFRQDLRMRSNISRVAIIVLSLVFLAFSATKGGLVLYAYLYNASYSLMHATYNALVICAFCFSLVELLLSLWSFIALRKISTIRRIHRLNTHGQEVQEDGKPVKKNVGLIRLASLARPVNINYLTSAFLYMLVAFACFFVLHAECCFVLSYAVFLLICEREMFYLMTHSTHFIYGYMASDIWLRTILIVRKETRCRHIGYSYRLAARFLLYAPSHRQDNTYHGLCYTSCGALAGTRNSSMGPPHEGSIRRPIAP